MRTVLVTILFLLLGSSFSQSFIGEIRGKLFENGINSEFIWRFEEDQTMYILQFESEGVNTKVEIIFDGDTTATLLTYQQNELINNSPISVSQLLSPVPVIVDQYSSEGTEIMNYSTEKVVARTQDRELASWMTDLSVNWHGAQYFFRDDVAFLIASQKEGRFPLKTLATDLKGTLTYSFEVTAIEKK